MMATKIGNTDSEEDYLEINNGLLIEKSNLFGTIVYKKK